MYGEFDGTDVRPGDPVHVVGRRGRRDVLTVHRLDVLSGIGGLVLSRLRSKVPGEVLVAQWTRRLVVILTSALLLLLVGQQVWMLLR